MSRERNRPSIKRLDEQSEISEEKVLSKDETKQHIEKEAAPSKDNYQDDPDNKNNKSEKLISKKFKKRERPNLKKDVDIKENENPEINEISLRSIRIRLQISFIFSLIVGIGIIFYFRDTAYGLLPLIAMFLYFVLGFKNLKSANAKPIFADSMYYLGFLFTFVSLLFAIILSGEIKEIVSQMGTALSTTIVGMAFRIVISHFDPIETNVNDAVFDEMSNMASQVRNLTSELTVSIENQLESIKDISSASAKQLTAMNSTLETISKMNSRDDNLTQFNDKFNKLSTQINDFVEKTEKAGNELVKFGTSTAAISSTLAASSSIVQDTKNFSERLSKLQNELEEAVKGSVDEKDNLTNAVIQIKKQIEETKNTINKTSEASLLLEENIEKRLTNILKLVRDN